MHLVLEPLKHYRWPLAPHFYSASHTCVAPVTYACLDVSGYSSQHARGLRLQPTCASPVVGGCGCVASLACMRVFVSLWSPNNVGAVRLSRQPLEPYTTASSHRTASGGILWLLLGARCAAALSVARSSGALRLATSNCLADVAGTQVAWVKGLCWACAVGKAFWGWGPSIRTCPNPKRPHNTLCE